MTDHTQKATPPTGTHDTAPFEDLISHDEYNRTPVPLNARLGFKDPAWVWSGFGIAFFSAVVGSIIQAGMGLPRAILAILLGNAILFVYSGAIGYGNGKWGMNFPLTVSAVFGTRGSILPITVVALLVTGWFSFNTWLTADVFSVLFGVQTQAVVGAFVVVLGLIYAAPVIFGIKSMANVRKLAIPAMGLFVAYYLITRVIPAGTSIFEGQGTGDLPFFTGVGMAWSIFVVSGTMTGDIVRYTKTGKQAVGVTAVAFMFSNGPFMIIGALMGAAIQDPDAVYFFDQSTLLILIPLAAIAFLSNWCTADACLYNAALGFTNSFKFMSFRTAAVVGMVIGLVAGASGLVGDVVAWLSLIGLIVPPIGGVIIADYFAVRRDARGYGVRRDAPWNWAAIIAATVGIAVAWLVNNAYPEFLFGAAGIVTSLVLYVALARLAGAQLGAQVGTEPTGAEALELTTVPTARPGAPAGAA